MLEFSDATLENVNYQVHFSESAFIISAAELVLGSVLCLICDYCVKLYGSDEIAVPIWWNNVCVFAQYKSGCVIAFTLLFCQCFRYDVQNKLANYAYIYGSGTLEGTLHYGVLQHQVNSCFKEEKR